VEQGDRLFKQCGVTISAATSDGAGTLEVISFDTSTSSLRMSDLGSPHRSCGGHRVVRAPGGHSAGRYPNCEPQHNVLILKQPRKNTLDTGGCLNVDFGDPVMLHGLGLLNVPYEEPVKVTIMNGDGSDIVILSPDNLGKNSLWKVLATNPEIQRKGVVIVTLCFSGSRTALSYINFSSIAKEASITQRFKKESPVGEEEEEFPWCSELLMGLMMETKNGSSRLLKPVSGYSPVKYNQTLHISELPEDFIVAMQPSSDAVKSIRIFLPSEDVFIEKPPFALSSLKLLHNIVHGPLAFRVDAYGSVEGGTTSDTFLGSCTWKMMVKK